MMRDLSIVKFGSWQILLALGALHDYAIAFQSLRFMFEPKVMGRRYLGREVESGMWLLHGAGLPAWDAEFAPA